MVAEEVIITLSGGAPWGFRLQGGVEHQKPLQVAKVRKRSKACRAGLRESDELVSINQQPCGKLSHAQAMALIDSTPGMLHIRVKRAPAGFQSVVLVTRAPSPRIDKEYRAALRAMSPSKPHHAPVREVHNTCSSLTSCVTSPPGSEAYYGETDSDADVAGYERQRRQKRRSPSNSNPTKPTGRASPEGGETSEMSGYDSAPDAHDFSRLLDGRGGNGDGGGGLPGVARREVIYQPSGLGVWSSQTSTETSSVISSADDQGPRDGGQEEDSGLPEVANVPLVSPERAKEAMMLSSRSQLVPMVGPLNKPIDEGLTTTYKEKAKQAKLNRGDTSQDKHVKEAKSKCRTIAFLLTDAPNPHSKGVLMFKKRRQRSKKYTLTSFGSVDKDSCPSSQEEDGVFPGSESEFDEDGFSSVPDPTWDTEYLDMLEKRASAGTEGRGVEVEDTAGPMLNDTTGKGAQLFEQQRKRAAEHAKRAERAKPQSEIQVQSHMQSTYQSQQMTSPVPTATQVEFPQVTEPVVTYGKANGDIPYSPVSTDSTMSPPPIAPKLATASVTMFSRPAPPAETPVPEVSVNNVLNRTARPFTPGFISIRAATTPVTFRPPVAKTIQRPASAAVGLTTFSKAADLNTNATSVTPPGLPPVYYSSSSILQGPLAPTSKTHVTVHPTAISTSEEKMQSTPLTTVASMHPACISSLPLAPRPTTPASVALSSEISGLDQNFATTPSTPPQGLQPEEVAPTPVPGPRGRTGILLEARRRGGKANPMFNVPDVVKNSPNPDLLTMVQKLDDRAIQQKHGQPVSNTIYYGEEEERIGEVRKEGAPPPIAPKPKVIHETPQLLQAGGKGAELFARRQSRMGMYSMDTHKTAPQSVPKPLDSSSSSSHPSKWKYSPNVRAPPPIGYNPLLTPTITMGPQRETSKPDNRGQGGSKREGIKALDFMRRQPYQLNSAMFNYGGSATNQSAMPSYQAQRQQHGDYTTTMMGSSLTPPKQIPIKTTRAYEVKRFSTPTPMSAPTLIPKVIAPRSATTLGERLTHSDMNSPPSSPSTPTPGPVLKGAAFNATASPPFQTAGLPTLPKLFSTSIPNPVPHAVPKPYTPISFSTGLQSAKQFQSAPELCVLASLPPLKSNIIQAPKPRFVATKGGIQPRVWRPGAI